MSYKIWNKDLRQEFLTDMAMKQLLIILLVCTMASGCKKENSCLDSGIITGLDARDCMCCGGWFIKISDTTYRFDQVPPECTIDFSTVVYPLNVRLEWKKKDTLCLGDEIRVSKLLREGE